MWHRKERDLFFGDASQGAAVKFISSEWPFVLLGRAVRAIRCSSLIVHPHSHHCQQRQVSSMDQEPTRIIFPFSCAMGHGLGASPPGPTPRQN